MKLNETPLKKIAFISHARHLPLSDGSLLMVPKGPVYIYEKDQSRLLWDNDIVLIYGNNPTASFPGGTCTASLSEPSQMILLEFKPGILTSNGQNGTFMCDSQRLPDADYMPLRNAIARIAAVYLKNEPFGQDQLSSLVFGLSFLLKKDYFAAASPKLQGNRYDERLAQITEYIHANYQQTVTLEDLAAHLHLSTPYLSKFFKANFNTTFTSYLNRLRFECASSQIIHSSQPITDIIHNHGYSNMHTFTAQFREVYQQTPSQYRKAHEKQQTPAKEHQLCTMSFNDCHQAIEHYIYPESEDMAQLYPSKRISASVNITDRTQSVLPFWKQMINVGTIQNLLARETTHFLEEIQRHIGFAYGGISCILSQQSFNYDRRLNKYNFLNFDHAINALHYSGLVPYLELALSPEELDATDYQIDLDAYTGSLKALLHHCQHLFNAQALEHWRFEISFAHNLYRFQHESVTAFTRRFKQASTMIRQLFPKAPIGGIGFFIAYPNELFEKLIKTMAREQLQPNFISIILYPYEFDTHQTLVYVTDTARLAHKLGEFKAILKKYHFKRTQLIVSHFAPDHLFKIFLNDTCYQATFLTHLAIGLQGNIHFAGYDFISDSALTQKHSAHFVDGYSGLFTECSLPKPGFFALTFLSHLKGNILWQDEHCIMTSGNDGSYSILMVNHVPLSNYYSHHPNEHVLPRQAYSVYEVPASLHMTLHLNGLENGTYKAVSYRLSRESGSIFDMWQSMNHQEEDIWGDIEYFQQIVQPRRQYSHWEITDQQSTVEMKLLPYETVLIELKKGL